MKGTQLHAIVSDAWVAHLEFGTRCLALLAPIVLLASSSHVEPKNLIFLKKKIHHWIKIHIQYSSWPGIESMVQTDLNFVEILALQLENNHTYIGG